MRLRFKRNYTKLNMLLYHQLGTTDTHLNCLVMEERTNHASNNTHISTVGVRFHLKDYCDFVVIETHIDRIKWYHCFD